MTFIKDQLPDAASYFESEGLKLTSKGKWRTASCTFHGGSDSMRVNMATGAWCCMACGAKGGDVLGYHMAAHGMEFIDAAKALGAWQDDGKAHALYKSTVISARQALAVLALEVQIAAIELTRYFNGIPATDGDLGRLREAAARISFIQKEFAL